MNVALLGATGFVGSGSLQEALDRGRVVTLMASSQQGRYQDLSRRTSQKPTSGLKQFLVSPLLPELVVNFQWSHQPTARLTSTNFPLGPRDEYAKK